MSTSSFLVFVLICFVSLASCEERKGPELNGTTIIWHDNFDTESSEGSTLKTEYDAKGLQPWYDFANSFISTVLNKEPYDLILKAKVDGTSNLNIKDDLILGYALGMIITIGIGVLFCLLMPIVGFCFCCCRLCGKCGGEMSQKDNPNNNCKRAVFGVILLMITLLMFTGVLLTFVCNDRMSETVDEMDSTSRGILNEAISFINRTVGEVEKLLVDDFGFVTKQLTNDISNEQLEALVGDPLLTELDQVSVKPIEAVKKLSEETKTMRDQLRVISVNSHNLTALSVDLQRGLNDAKDNLTNIQSNCSDINPPPNFCNEINTDGLDTQANFTNLPNVSRQLSNVEDVISQDFEKSANDGLEEVTTIPQKVINDTQDTRNEITNMIGDASETVEKMRKDLRKIADNDVVSELKKLRDTDIPSYKEDAEQYDNYRWMAGVGLTCILLLIVVLMALGLMCGVCGHDKEATPTTRGSVSNMGGLSLMAAAGFCFIFASFLMLLTTICFLIGAPVQTVCKSIQSGEIYSQVLDNPTFWGSDGYFLSRTIFGENKSNIEFTIGGLINNCRANKPLFQAGPFDQAFNITDRLNIEKLLGNDTTQQFNDLKVNLSDVNILNNDTRQSLIDLSNSGVDEIDFGAFLNQTQQSITAVDLNAFADNLTTLATKFQEIGNNNTLGQNQRDKAYQLGNDTLYTAEGLRNLQSTTVTEMETKSGELDRNVTDLRRIGGNLKVLANDTLAEATKAENYLHTNSSRNINKIVTDYTDRVLGWGYQFTDHILDVLNNEIARCKPVTNIYDATIVVICNQALYPFNGFWFSIGYCLFFFIPAIIFSVKLAKHYRKMDYESDFDHDYPTEVIEMGHHPSAPPQYPGTNEKKQWANPNGYNRY
ncbi:prominin-1-A-like isoform X3 [Orbicella faveolata]|uniref:prominin-1-A-like isoform X3 n=1 Tax=Orbicella faveolata TaxID=48498 RepID=UPI0009E32DDC|nr:prominin-1-A-like isoform X3 [Orbicella faveolata]